MGFFDAFTALKRELTGEVIQQIDTPIAGGLATMSVRLKMDRKTNERYVVVAMLGRGSRWYASFDRHQFLEFSEAVETIRDSIMRPQADSQ